MQSKLTDTLWTATHSALSAGKWSEARALLDNLGKRLDVVDRLLTVEQYQKMSGRPLASGYRDIIADRIELVNAHIGR